MASEIYDLLLPELLQFDVLGASGCGIPNPRCNLLLVVKQIHFADDDTLNENQLLFWDIQQSLPPCQVKIWIFNAIETSPGTFRFDEQSIWQSVDKSPCSQRPIHALELFGGGMGGWKAAGTFLSSAFQQQWETVAVEQQLEVAMCYAITHDTGFLTTVKDLPRNFICKSSTNWTICADIRDATWYPMIAEWGVDALLLSPPCQP